MIFDNDHRRIIDDWIETREEAEARLAALIENDPAAEGVLVIMGELQPPS